MVAASAVATHAVVSETTAGALPRATPAARIAQLTLAEKGKLAMAFSQANSDRSTWCDTMVKQLNDDAGVERRKPHDKLRSQVLRWWKAATAPTEAASAAEPAVVGAVAAAEGTVPTTLDTTAIPQPAMAAFDDAPAALNRSVRTEAARVAEGAAAVGTIATVQHTAAVATVQHTTAVTFSAASSRESSVRIRGQSSHIPVEHDAQRVSGRPRSTSTWMQEYDTTTT